MLMEPDEYTSQERALTDKAKELIEQHELDWGNGECFIQRDAGHSELYMTLEAPNHATATTTTAVWRWRYASSPTKDARHWNPTSSHGLANRSTPQAATTTAARNPWTASGTT